MQLKVGQYRKAFKSLTNYQLRTLHIMYAAKRNAIKASTMATLLHGEGSDLLNANRAVGSLGRTFAKLSEIRSPQPYYQFVGAHSDTGWTIHRNLIKAIRKEKLFASETTFYLRTLAEEAISSQQLFNEGKLSQVLVNRYERSSAARQACFRAHGYNCFVCGRDLEKTYGPAGKDIIEVHHKVELATIKRSYVVDPVKDLIPVCPCCHALLHTTRPAMSLRKAQHLCKKSS